MKKKDLASEKALQKEGFHQVGLVGSNELSQPEK